MPTATCRTTPGPAPLLLAEALSQKGPLLSAVSTLVKRGATMVVAGRHGRAAIFITSSAGRQGIRRESPSTRVDVCPLGSNRAVSAVPALDAVSVKIAAHFTTLARRLPTVGIAIVTQIIGTQGVHLTKDWVRLR